MRQNESRVVEVDQCLVATSVVRDTTTIGKQRFGLGCGHTNSLSHVSRAVSSGGLGHAIVGRFLCEREHNADTAALLAVDADGWTRVVGARG